ncbi:MAG: peptidylprolyl isomerase [Gammaproteobacteria bacterium]|nr:peptidylprolyl isomerase [Gammaproteobacteria bacterium]
MKKILVVLAVAVAFGVGIYVIRSQQLSQHPGTNNLAEVNSTGTSVATDEQAGDELRSAQFGYEQLVLVVASLNDEQREAVLADQKLFGQFVSKEALRLSLIDAANASQFANNDKIQFLLKRQADDFLVDSYIKHRLQAAGVPEGFPGEQQIQQFYETNKQRYLLAERVPVWQIFWPIADNASKPEMARLLKKASLLANDIKKGRTTFEQAALGNSQHAASRLQGGYMGMLLTSDLRPKIKGQLLALKENAISKPIRGENGVHLFRRGAIQPAEMLPLGQVRGQVVRELIQALREQQRAQLAQLAQSQYPVEYHMNQLDDWMMRAADSFQGSKIQKTQ